MLEIPLDPTACCQPLADEATDAASTPWRQCPSAIALRLFGVLPSKRFLNSVGVLAQLVIGFQVEKVEKVEKVSIFCLFSIIAFFLLFLLARKKCLPIEAHWTALRGKPHFEGVGLRAKCFLHFLHFLPFLPFLPFLHLPVFFSLGTQPPRPPCRWSSNFTRAVDAWLSHGVDAVCIVAAQGLYQLCVVLRDAPVVGIRPQAALLLQC